MGHSKTVSVIVPTFRRPGALRKTLGALTQMDFPREQYDVIVVDDGLDDETRMVVEEFAVGSWSVSYVPQDPAGVATARNHGAAEAKGDLLVFVDDDIVVRPDHLKRHLADQARFGDALVNGHWEFAPDNRAEL